MRCPVCRAENDQGASCRRCKADLTLLFAVQTQRDAVLAQARDCLLRAQPRKALALAQGADTLKTDEDSRQLIALSALLKRDFAGAWASYCQDIDARTFDN